MNLKLIRAKNTLCHTLIKLLLSRKIYLLPFRSHQVIMKGASVGKWNHFPSTFPPLSFVAFWKESIFFVLLLEEANFDAKLKYRMQILRLFPYQKLELSPFYRKTKVTYLYYFTSSQRFGELVENIHSNTRDICH